MTILQDFGYEVWRILLELSPYLLLGLVIAGLLHLYMEPSFVKKHLGKNNFISILKAALIGIPLPLCSCGVIPTAISFKNQGASEGATVSFLISTPQTGIDSILVSYSILNGPWSLFRPFVSLISGVFGGWIGWGLINQKEAEVNSHISENTKKTTVKPKTFKRFFDYAFVCFLSDISRPLILGILISAVITLFLPQSIFTQYLTHPNLNMFLILVASIPLYVCATGSIPIAAALLAKGLSPGAVMVFLMAGPATNAATITVLWNALGKRTTILYICIISFFAFLFGWIMNVYLPVEWFSILPSAYVKHNHNSMLPQWLTIGSTLLLLLAILNVEFQKLISKPMTYSGEETNTYIVEGMTCNHCKSSVEKGLLALEGVEKITISLAQNKVIISGNVSSETVKNTIEKLGYTFKQ